MQLSQRLEQLIDFIPKGSRIIDTCTDHGYVPVEAVLRGIAPFAIASDIARGPLQSAVDTIEANKVSDKVEARLSNGLAAITLADAIDVAIVAGVGGRLIVEILDTAPVVPNYLILQPNVADNLVRAWLYEHQFEIVAEATVYEQAIYYPIIVARAAGLQVVADGAALHLLVGRQNIGKQDADFCGRWQQELHHAEQLLAHLETAENTEEKRVALAEKIALIKEALSDVDAGHN